MATVWERHREYGDKKQYEAVTKVDVSFYKQGVNISVTSYAKGPRGGYSSGGNPGFTLDEWKEIVKAVDNELAKGQQLELPVTYSDDWKPNIAHDCLVDNDLEYVADIGAPGYGQSWRCKKCHYPWTKVGERFIDPMHEEPPMFTPSDVR